jgi:hypothetical protein
MAKGSRSFGGARPAVCARQEAKGRVSTPDDALGMAGEPDTSKGVRPVRREAHRNLVWQQTKALCVHPIVLQQKKFGAFELGFLQKMSECNSFLRKKSIYFCYLLSLLQVMYWILEISVNLRVI